MPKRIQRRRSKGWRMPAGAINCTRPGPWGNPFKWTDLSSTLHCLSMGWNADDHHDLKRAAVDLFKRWVENDKVNELVGLAMPPLQIRRPTPAIIKRDLAGKDLACFCSLNSSDPCHVDYLLETANS